MPTASVGHGCNPRRIAAARRGHCACSRSRLALSGRTSESRSLAEGNNSSFIVARDATLCDAGCLAAAVTVGQPCNMGERPTSPSSLRCGQEMLRSPISVRQLCSSRAERASTSVRAPSPTCCADCQLRGSKGFGENASGSTVSLIPTSRAQDNGTPADSSRPITCNRALPAFGWNTASSAARVSSDKACDQSSAGNQRSRCSQRCSSNSQASSSWNRSLRGICACAVSATTNASMLRRCSLRWRRRFCSLVRPCSSDCAAGVSGHPFSSASAMP